MYRIEFAPEALVDVAKLKRNEPSAYKKLEKLIEELKEHPQTGIGHPKPLGGDRVGQWSRRLTDKHRLVYSILEDSVLVIVLSAYGHYDDK